MKSETHNLFIAFIISSAVIAMGYVMARAVEFSSEQIANILGFENQLQYVDENFLTDLPEYIEEHDALAEEKETTTLIAVGDIMLDRGVGRTIAKVGAGNYTFPFTYVADELRSADILFGNLEGPISDKGRNVGSLYSFRMHPLATDALKQVGFDVLSFANNHAGDWSTEAFLDTIERLDEVEIGVAGAGRKSDEAYAPVIKEIDGVRYGFLAFTDVGPNWLSAGSTSPGIAIASEKSVIDAVINADKVADVIIVSFHFGDEYTTTPSPRQRLLAEAAVDAGAEVVLGHHPHVSQPVEEYHGGIIAYSLGNFIFDQRFSEETSKGIVLEIVFKEGKIDRHEVHEVKFNSYYQPEMVD